MRTQLVNERGHWVRIGAVFVLATLLWGVPGGAEDAPSAWLPVTAASMSTASPGTSRSIKIRYFDLPRLRS